MWLYTVRGCQTGIGQEEVTIGLMSSYESLNQHRRTKKLTNLGLPVLGDSGWLGTVCNEAHRSPATRQVWVILHQPRSVCIGRFHNNGYMSCLYIHQNVGEVWFSCFSRYTERRTETKRGTDERTDSDCRQNNHSYML